MCVGGLAGGVYGWGHAEHAGGRSVGGVGVWRCGGGLPAGGCRLAGWRRVAGAAACVRGQARRRGGRWAAPPFSCGVGGGVLLSHTLAGAVPSALAVLASGFGKERSGRVPAAMTAATRSRAATPPPRGGCGVRVSHSGRGSPSPQRKEREEKRVGLVGPLVPVGFTPLRGVHVRSINPVVFGGPSHPAKGGWWRTRLEAGFPLRCFQRLSLPNVANQPCSWRNNWHTRGSSVPVLSYWGQPFSILLRAQRIGTELSHDVLNPARVPL